MSRSITDNRALAAVLAGNLVAQFATAAVVARALIAKVFPVQFPAISALVLHTLLGTAFAIYLARMRTELQDNAVADRNSQTYAALGVRSLLYGFFSGLFLARAVVIARSAATSPISDAAPQASRQ